MRNLISFALSGIVAVIVGCFMLRGTMHLWDKKDRKNQTKDNKDSM
jgi:hypothetical protein